MSYIIPSVVERDARGERSWDIYSRLLKDRIVFLGAPIYDEVANAVIARRCSSSRWRTRRRT